MAIRVGPTEKQPTHHVKLTDRNGNSVGLILCNDKGDPAPMYNRTPIDRSALKTASGQGAYSDLQPPYSPIVQDDWSGGRGNMNFEADSTRYNDSFRVTTRHSNKAFLGPKEFLSNGYKTLTYSSDTDTDGHLNTYGVADAVIDATYGYQIFTIGTIAATVTRIWVHIRKKGNPTGDIDFTLLKDYPNFPTPTVLDTVTITNSQVDHIGQWIALDVSHGGGTNISLHADQGTFTDTDRFEFLYRAKAADPLPINLRYRFETAEVDDTCIYYEYKGQQYKVLSTAGAAPTVWMNGDRGVADSNAGQLTKVIDATKAWTVNAWAGCIVKIVQGTGKAEAIQYRTISSNTATELTVSSAWTIQHDTTTEYVILGSDTWRELTGHGLTVPVTSVLVVTYPVAVVYFAQGDSVLIRSHRELQSAGAWVDSEWRAETSNYATHLAYQPLANKIWRGQNTDGSSFVSVSSATPAGYAVDLTFAAAITVGYNYDYINGLEVYPNDSGTEALWVYKEELAYVVTTTATGIKLDEMKHLRSRDNGKANLVHNVYSYFSLGNGLQRYYGGSIDSVGPNLDEGLPTDRQGKIVQLLGYPGRIMAIIDGGASGYSSLLERDGSGWHEVYRAPKGEQIKAMSLQVIPGTTVDRLWVYQGNMSVWMPISSGAINELEDTNYRYTHEGAIVLSRMHAGMFDVQKIIKDIKIWSDGLDGTELGETDNTSMEIDYRIDDDTDWTQLTSTAIYSPVSTITSNFGIAGKRIQIRIRMYSRDDRVTPVLLAVILDAVMRTQIKYMYNLTFRVMDDEPTLAPREMDEDSVTAASMSAITKLTQIENWADADTEGLLYMESNSPLYNGKYIFLNPPVTRQIATDPDSTKRWTGYGFVCSTTAQEA